MQAGRAAGGERGAAGQDTSSPGGGTGTGSHQAAPGRDRPRLPPVRLAPREELAAAARVAPLLRAARDLCRWAQDGHGLASGTELAPDAAAAAAAALELAPREVDAAWRVAVATQIIDLEPGAAKPGDGKPGAVQPGAAKSGTAKPAAAQSGDGKPGAGRPGAGRPGGLAAVLASGEAEEVLAAWDCALAAILLADDLDGLATALYTVGDPVRMDGLFDAYAAAAGTQRRADQPVGGPSGDDEEPEEGAALSYALETLADLGVVELGTEESAGGLTVALSPLGIWGVHRRLRAQGWHVPVLGGAGRDGAAGLLATLASCDAEDGETEIGTWLAARAPAQAAAELIAAAASGSPGLRGAAFAVLDRIGELASAEVRSALAEPVLRAHAAVWLHEHGEEAELRPEDRTWLLVDLGSGLLEEADPRDVVAELLPELPAKAQAEIVAGLWQVRHPGVTDLLTALSDHHPDPAVARAARKAAFKARSPAASDSRPAS